MNAKEKIVQAGGAVSAGASVLGSYQLCHSICMFAIALLSVIGITVTGMPLLFLTKVAAPFWIAGVSLMVLMLLLWHYNILHFSPKLLLANSGLLVAGVPFGSVASFQIFFWVVGGIVLISAVAWALVDKNKRACCHQSK